MKRIDQLLVKNFVPPFVVTFFIAQFVLVMQTLWVYIDDIAGKGVGFFLMVELLSYMSVSMIPLALPIAVLISSVMVLGNMAERYELSSFKSAGVSLSRVLLPLSATTIFIAGFSFLCSNSLIPISNLQFKSRLHDIRKQKPTLSMEEGLFNDDFEGYSIRIGEKMPDNRRIKNVLLYDHSEASEGRLVSVTAKEGEMYATEDEGFFIMHLENGNQYSEPKPTKKGQGKERKENAPFIRTKFQEWYKVFDLDEFELDQTDRDLFKSHHSMLSTGQLQIAIDSIDNKIEDRKYKMGISNEKYFYLADQARKAKLREEKKKKKEEDKLKNIPTDIPKIPKNIKKPEGPKKKIPPKTGQKKPKSSSKATNKKQSKTKKNTSKKNQKKKSSSKKNSKKTKKKKKPRNEPIPQKIEKPLAEYASIVQLFPKEKHAELYDKSKTFARSIGSQAESTLRTIKRLNESKVSHLFEMHSKFSMAVACIIFLFIGAPMGAIVRKGGFGWPLLISIIFFMIYIILTIFCKNIAERFVIDAVLAAWTPCLVILPIGLILSYQAMRDAKGLDFLKYLKTLFDLTRELILSKLKK